MHLQTFFLAVAALIFPSAIAQDISSALALLDELPSCAESCLSAAFTVTPCSKTDLYCICNNSAFNASVGVCETKTCSNVEFQELISLVPIICAPVGGLASTQFTTRYPNIPACANNCTSSALALSGCGPYDVTCACKNPIYLDVYGPCVEASCDAADRAAFTAASQVTCAAVGGSGPYNASQIGGYLNYTIPNGTAPYVPLINSSATATSMISPISTFAGGVGSIRMGNEERLWMVVGFIAVMAGMM